MGRNHKRVEELTVWVRQVLSKTEVKEARFRFERVIYLGGSDLSFASFMKLNSRF